MIINNNKNLRSVGDGFVNLQYYFIYQKFELTIHKHKIFIVYKTHSNKIKCIHHYPLVKPFYQGGYNVAESENIHAKCFYIIICSSHYRIEKGRIIKKIPYERRVYESVDDESLS